MANEETPTARQVGGAWLALWQERGRHGPPAVCGCGMPADGQTIHEGLYACDGCLRLNNDAHHQLLIVAANGVIAAYAEGQSVATAVNRLREALPEPAF